jgi:hypothetical protein
MGDGRAGKAGRTAREQPPRGVNPAASPLASALHRLTSAASFAREAPHPPTCSVALSRRSSVLNMNTLSSGVMLAAAVLLVMSSAPRMTLNSSSARGPPMPVDVLRGAFGCSLVGTRVAARVRCRTALCEAVGCGPGAASLGRHRRLPSRAPSPPGHPAPPCAPPRTHRCRSTSAISWRRPKMPPLVPSSQSSSQPIGQLSGAVSHISTRTMGAMVPPMDRPWREQTACRCASWATAVDGKAKEQLSWGAAAGGCPAALLPYPAHTPVSSTRRSADGSCGSKPQRQEGQTQRHRANHKAARLWHDLSKDHDGC